MPLIKLEQITPEIQFGIWHISESVDELFESIKLSEKDTLRFNNFSNEKRKRQWLSCRRIIEHVSPGSEIQYTSSGKPKINNGYISMSHSKDYASVIINNRHETGIDIQKIESKVERIRDKFLHPEENERISQKDFQELTLIWAVKEAIYKSIDSDQLIFKEHIITRPITHESIIIADVSFNQQQRVYQLKYEIIDNYSLVYLID